MLDLDSMNSQTPINPIRVHLCSSVVQTPIDVHRRL